MKFPILDLSHALAEALYKNALYAGSAAPEADDEREAARDVMHAVLAKGIFPSAQVTCSEKARAGLHGFADMIAFMRQHSSRFPSDASIEKYMRACSRSRKLSPGKEFLKKAFSISKLKYPTWAELFGSQVAQAAPAQPSVPSEYDVVVFDPAQIYNNRGLYQNGVAVEASEDDDAFNYEDPDALLS